jgi:hypothetical protein
MPASRLSNLRTRRASESNLRETVQTVRSAALLVKIHEDPYEDDRDYAEDSCGSGVSEIAALG